MSATRLGSDLSLPQRDFSQLTVTIAATGVAQVFTATRTVAENVILYAPTTNVAAINIGPTSGASYRPLQAGDEWKIPIESLSCVNIAAWYAKGTLNDVLTVIYQ